MNSDTLILKELGCQLAEIASLPIQEEKKKLWRANNSLRPLRPMVFIEQLPWHELNDCEELTLKCEDEFLREIEQGIRRTLYKWHHFPADMVVENQISIPKTINGLHYGLRIKEEIIALDSANSVVSHKYIDQCESEEALAALSSDQVQIDKELDNQRLASLKDIFQGIIPVRLSGIMANCAVWDRISKARPAEAIMYDIADRPEFVLKIAEKFRDLTLSTLEQCEELGLLDVELPTANATIVYTDDLPPLGYDPLHPKASDCWSFGMAQIFSTVGPDTHEELEIDIMKPLYERFGLINYGCCEPLEKKIHLIRKIRNVRKISVSPWAKIDESAEQMGRDYVFSGKAHPSFVASGQLDKENVIKQTEQMIQSCRRSNTPCEIVLKDISTVSYRPKTLSEWEKAVMQLAQA